jgi:acetoin utilization deacetylase AcuC-like enzyme
VSKKIPVFFNEEQLSFQPKYEWVLGKKIKHPETTRRAQSIYRALKTESRLFSIQPTPDIPVAAIRQSHNYQLITLYSTAQSMPEGEIFHPCVFPQRKTAHPDPTNINHAGFYCFDSGTPLNRDTWVAAAWSAASAYHAAKEVRSGQSKVSYALSRPPGHHANRDSFGGYCYFNNAGIAARALRKQGRVAIVDIDFHHGNGTQDMFYDNEHVLTISIHANPKRHFPYFAGFPEEVGSGKGEGYNMNIILNDGTGATEYIKTLKNIVLPAVRHFEPDYLVVAAGFDTYEHDPIGSFKIKTPEYELIGKTLSLLDLPTVIIQEGGYFTRDLGANVVSFLKGFQLLNNK